MEKRARRRLATAVVAGIVVLALGAIASAVIASRAESDARATAAVHRHRASCFRLSICATTRASAYVPVP